MKINNSIKKLIASNSNGYLSSKQNARDLEKYLRLDLGENLIGNSPIDKYLSQVTNNTLRYYADPSNYLIKKEISRLYRISDKNVSIANSSNEIIDFIPRIFGDSGDVSVIITPTFFRFENSLKSNGLRPYFIRLKEKNGFRYTDNIIKKIISKTNSLDAKIIWVCNPNNPTGEVLELSQIEELTKKTNSLVVVDEAFFEFYNPTNNRSAISLINYQNIVVLRTLSKAYGLAGVRFGYCIAHEKTIDIIEKARDTLLMTSALQVFLASKAISNREFTKSTSISTSQARKELFRKIEKLDNFHIGADSKTNIFLLRHKSKKLHHELKVRGILTTNFNDCEGIKDKQYVRITISTKKNNIKLLNALKDIN